MNWNYDLHKTIATERQHKADRARLTERENDERRGKRARRNR